jgi:hypothetical protein
LDQLAENNVDEDASKNGIADAGSSEMNKSSENIHKVNKELKEEMDLDFEEISDGELEEELKFKGIFFI